MTAPETHSGPLRERWLPQASIRFFLFLIGASAGAMYCFRAALVEDQFWAKIASLLIATAASCFVVYALLFLLANVFTATTDPIRRALETGRHADQSESGDTRSAGRET